MAEMALCSTTPWTSTGGWVSGIRCASMVEAEWDWTGLGGVGLSRFAWRGIVPDCVAWDWTGLGGVGLSRIGWRGIVPDLVAWDGAGLCGVGLSRIGWRGIVPDWVA